MISFHPVRVIRKLVAALQSFDKAPLVVVGDRFTDTDKAVSVWIVDRISDVGMSEYPLISLSCEGYPELTKTVSISVLQEQESFRRAG